jgi:hypothetical protein
VAPKPPPENREALLRLIHDARGAAPASVMQIASDAELAEFVASLRRSGLVPPPSQTKPSQDKISPSPEKPPMDKAKPQSDPALARRQQQALAFIDKAIQPINREVIHKAIPGLNRDKFIEFAAVVAELRADYLATALLYFVDQRQHTATEAGLAVLKGKRETYEEALLAYEALHRALERGYVDPLD